MSHGDSWCEIELELPHAVFSAVGRAAHLELSRGRVAGGVGHAAHQARPRLR